MADADSKRIVSRAEAKALGLKRYFTGSACSDGHIAPRTTVDGQCTECCRLKMRRRRAPLKAAAKAEARANFEAEVRRAKRVGVASDRSVAKAAGLVFYFTGGACKRGHVAQRHVAGGNCVVCAAEHTLARYARERESDRIKSRQWRERNPTYRADYRARNPDLVRAIRSRADAKRRTRKAGGATPAQVAAWLKIQQRVCHWCGCKCHKAFHVDHIQPLSKGGEHAVTNLCIACPTCNLRKSARDPIEFAQSLGLLL